MIKVSFVKDHTIDNDGVRIAAYLEMTGVGKFQIGSAHYILSANSFHFSEEAERSLEACGIDPNGVRDLYEEGCHDEFEVEATETPTFYNGEKYTRVVMDFASNQHSGVFEDSNQHKTAADPKYGDNKQIIWLSLKHQKTEITTIFVRRPIPEDRHDCWEVIDYTSKEV